MLSPGVLRYFGFDPDGDVVVVVLTDVGPVLAAEHEADRILRGSAPYLMASTDDEIVLVLPADDANRGRDIHRRLGAQLQRPLGGGVSVPGPLSSITESLYQARTAARVHQSEFSAFSGLGTFGVILGTRTAAELQLLAHPLTLLDDDVGEHSTGKPTLIETLETFLGNNRQVEPTAVALGIHRHTLRNRLQRISSVLGRDLSSADTRPELWVAIKARGLLALRSELPDAGTSDR